VRGGEIQKIKQISAKVNRREKHRSHKRLIEMEREIQSPRRRRTRENVFQGGCY